MLGCCPVNFTEVYSGIRTGEEERTKDFYTAWSFTQLHKKSPPKPGCFAATGDREGKPFQTQM